MKKIAASHQHSTIRKQSADLWNPVFRLLSSVLGLLLSACATASAVSGSQPLIIAQAPTSTTVPSATPIPPSETPTSNLQLPTPNSELPSSTPVPPTATLIPPTDTPTSPSPTPTATFTSTPTPTITLTASRTPTDTRTPTSTFTATFTRTPTPTITPTFTPSLTFTPSPTRTPTPSSTPDARITERATHTPYAPAVFPTGDASKLKKPPANVKIDPHLFFIRPILNAAPSSQYRFGMTYDGKLAPHHGDDIGGGAGIAVGAAGAGTVFWAGDDLTQVFGTKNNFYGNLVVIQMNDTWNGHTVYTLYGHLSEVKVQVGQQVNPGDLVGLTGDTGVAAGPHLHFEVRLDDPFGVVSYFSNVRNPELWVKPNPRAGIIAGRVINSAGRFVPGVRVFIQCKDAMRFVDTYWDQGTPPDDVLFENFVMSDIPQGDCNIETTVRGKLYRTSAYVPPGEIAFVIIRTDDK